MSMQRLADRIAGLERKFASTADRATALMRKAETVANSASIPGLEHTRVAGRPPQIVEVKDLERLGTAGGRTFFAYRDGELRADVEVTAEATNDSLPAHRLIIHSTERVAKRIVEDPGQDEWSKSVRRTIDAHSRDRFWRATILPSGSYAAAVQSDRATEARKRLRPELVRLLSPHGMPLGRDSLDWYTRQGIEFRIEHDALTYRTDRGRLDPATRAIIRDQAPLIRGWVSGKPLACYGCTAEAVVLLEPSATPTCDSHAA